MLCRVLAGLHKATKRRYSCIVSVYYDYTIVPCSVRDCLVDWAIPVNEDKPPVEEDDFELISLDSN